MADPGLFYGGYEHFAYQSMAVVIGFVSQMLIAIIVWKILLEWLCMKILFQSPGARVSILETYLGVGYFDIDTKSALKDMLSCQNSTAKAMLLAFKHVCDDMAKGHQLDFLVCITRMKKVYFKKGTVKNMAKIFKVYCQKDANKFINITTNEEEEIKMLLDQDDYKAYDCAYYFVFDKLHHLVKEFLKQYAEGKGQLSVKFSFIHSICNIVII